MAAGRVTSALLDAGIIFDSTYSGKAFHALREDIKADPGYWKGRKVSHRIHSLLTAPGPLPIPVTPQLCWY